MKIIPQKRLFDYSEIEELGDLERLKAVLDYIPDAKLIEKLRKLRKNGRDEYPVVGMWNAFLASFVFQHHSINSLIRELSRNPTMLKLCGLKKVPTASAFTNFLNNLKT